MSADKESCFFRQIEAADPEAPPADLVRAFESPEGFVCRVGGCAIGGQQLLDYVLAFGRVAPREELDRLAAPSCAILDYLHDANVELARMHDEIPGFTQAMLEGLDRDEPDS